jgi:hypothetical protein
VGTSLRLALWRSICGAGHGVANEIGDDDGDPGRQTPLGTWVLKASDNRCPMFVLHVGVVVKHGTTAVFPEAMTQQSRTTSMDTHLIDKAPHKQPWPQTTVTCLA